LIIARWITTAWVLSFFSAPLLAEEGRTLAELRDAGSQALQGGDSAGAIAAAEGLARNESGEPAAWRLAGDYFLRAGEIDKSIVQFQRYIEQVPEQEPQLWQYGIALALTGEYEAGRKLFERHRTVNPHDVENALWHYYCIAKASTAEKAREAILPAPGDRRVPMEPLLRFYRGEAEATAVRAAVEELPPGSREYARAAFYADLYLAMHADAQGEKDRALELAAKAAAAEEVNYMTDVGRIYHRVLRDAAP
jgi:lipoprotein NlpI